VPGDADTAGGAAGAAAWKAGGDETVRASCNGMLAEETGCGGGVVVEGTRCASAAGRACGAGCTGGAGAARPTCAEGVGFAGAAGEEAPKVSMPSISSMDSSCTGTGAVAGVATAGGGSSTCSGGGAGSVATDGSTKGRPSSSRRVPSTPSR